MNKKLLLILFIPVYLLTLLLLLLLLIDALVMVGPTFVFIYLTLCISAILLSVRRQKLLNLTGYVCFLLLSGQQIYASCTGVRIHFWKLGIYFGVGIILLSTIAFLYQMAQPSKLDLFRESP